MAGTVHFERDGNVAVLVIDNPPVNAGSHDIRKAMLAAIAAVNEDPGITGAVLIGAGRTFIAGSDLREFDLPLDPPQLPEVVAAVENSPKPFLAALHGSALGGGFELALACDMRIVAPGTVVGLPETNLGIVPGSGGTQKLPRLVGVARAIEIICSGRQVPAEEALSLGLVDAIVSGDLRQEAVARVRAHSGGKQRVSERVVPADSPEAMDAATSKALGRGRRQQHIVAAIERVRSAAELPYADGMREERAVFQALRVAPVARALRHVFFAEREAARGLPGRKAAPQVFSRFGVIGSGTMGAGIATVLMQSGFEVVLIDSDQAALARGIKRIADNLDGAQAKGRLSAESRKAADARLHPASDLAALSGCDVIIEAVVEDLAVKQAVFRELEGLVSPDAILATNTSYLDVDAIASATSRPERVIGLHFFSPAHLMKLLEVVSGAASSEVAMATGLAIARALRKQPVEARNGFGFIGNRIYSSYRLACEYMLEDGALPHGVDEALEAFGFAMGPFTVSDQSGLDIAWRMRLATASRRDPAARYVEIADRLCEAGRFGRKTGAGFYRYSPEGRRERDPEVEALIFEASSAKGIARRTFSPEEIVQRAMAAMVNEALLLLEEGIALRASDVDVVLVNGYGFPRWLGGPLHWASLQDRQALSADCREFASQARRRMSDLARLSAP